jgi:hypothetical protein
MIIKVLKESGYDEAALGFSLSYNSTFERAKELFPKYAFGKSGETKFLEAIYLWLDITAPLFFWSEADTYRISSKQSQSTMHTITKRFLNQSVFEYAIGERSLSDLNTLIALYKQEDIDKTKVFLNIKNSLPSGFLQRRIWCINYRTFQNIYNQRINHRLPQWKYFCEDILKRIEHPEFIKKEK